MSKRSRQGYERDTVPVASFHATSSLDGGAATRSRGGVRATGDRGVNHRAGPLNDEAAVSSSPPDVVDLVDAVGNVEHGVSSISWSIGIPLSVLCERPAVGQAIDTRRQATYSTTRQGLSGRENRRGVGVAIRDGARCAVSPLLRSEQAICSDLNMSRNVRRGLVRAMPFLVSPRPPVRICTVDGCL